MNIHNSARKGNKGLESCGYSSTDHRGQSIAVEVDLQTVFNLVCGNKAG